MQVLVWKTWRKKTDREPADRRSTGKWCRSWSDVHVHGNNVSRGLEWRLYIVFIRASGHNNVIDECRLFFSFMLSSEKIEKEESVSRANSRIVPVCCTILTYVHNYVNI